jgi:hypothetical protein
MDSSLHVSSHLNASRPRVMEHAQTESLRLKVQNFTKEYVSLIRLLSTIFMFTAAVETILTKSQLCILLCSSHRDPNNFGPKWISQIISCMMHTATMSQQQKALGTYSTFRIPWLLIQGNGIKMKECL